MAAYVYTKLSCKKCNWSKVKGGGCVVGPGHPALYKYCPRCGTELEHKPAGFKDILNPTNWFF